MGEGERKGREGKRKGRRGAETFAALSGSCDERDRAAAAPWSHLRKEPAFLVPVKVPRRQVDLDTVGESESRTPVLSAWFKGLTAAVQGAGVSLYQVDQPPFVPRLEKLGPSSLLPTRDAPWRSYHLRDSQKVSTVEE